MKNHIVIIGGGISGLSMAFYLRRAGHEVTVLEKSERPGGVIRSERQEGFLVEHGPNSTLETTPILRELFAKLGILDSLCYANEQSKNRYIVRDARLQALPMSPPAFLRTGLFSTRAKLRLLKEPFIKPSPAEAEESLADFVTRRIGREFLDYAINPFVAGVYAGSPETLSVKSAFPKLHQLEQTYGSLIRGAILGARERRRRVETEKTKARLLTFQEGLQTLVDALAKSLGERLQTGAEVRQVRRNEEGYEILCQIGGEARQILADALVMAIPAHAYRNFPIDIDPALRNALSEISYPAVNMVYFGYRRAPVSIPLDGFGMLVPEKERRRILGTIWSSTIFPERAPQDGVALTTFVGGSRQPEIAGLPDDQLIAAVREDLKDLMRISAPPDIVQIRRWPQAIPQYRLGHQQIIAAIEATERNQPGLFITGNFRGGISVGDCIKQSHSLSDAVGAHLASGEEAWQNAECGMRNGE